MRTRDSEGPCFPELFQAEWCPASRRVRQRLTELGVAYVCRQVPVARDERLVLKALAGKDSIPALVSEGGRVLVGEELILDYLDERYEATTEAEEHRLKAENVRRRELEEATR